MCVCVCVYFLWFVTLIHKHVVSLLCLFCLLYPLYCVLIDSCIFTALVTEKEDQKATVGFEILHLTSELNLCLKCLDSFFLSNFSFYLIFRNSVLFYQVR